MIWDVEINDVTAAMALADRIRANPDLWERDIDESDLKPVLTRRYKTRRGVDACIDRFMADLGTCHMLEHTSTAGEVYLRFLHTPDNRIYEISVRSSQ